MQQGAKEARDQGGGRCGCSLVWGSKALGGATRMLSCSHCNAESMTCTLSNASAMGGGGKHVTGNNILLRWRHVGR